MTRGRYPARLKLKPIEPHVFAKYHRFWNSADLYARPEIFPRIDAAHFFGNQRPLELEVGCGTGEFLCELAAREPEINFLGIDMGGKPLHRAIEYAIEKKLENVRFIQADVRFIYPLLAPDTLAAVHIQFPVPYEQHSRSNRRIFAPDAIAHLHRALAPGGRLCVLTDHEWVYRQLRDLLHADPRFAPIPAEHYRVAITDEMKSYHQRLWEKQGRPIYRCEFVKQALYAG